MLFLALFICLSAVALPTIPSTAPLLLRTTSLILLAALALASNAACWQGISYGVSLYCGTLQFTQVASIASIAVCGVASLAIVGWAPSWISNTITSIPRVKSYSLFALMTVLGGCLLTMAGNLVTVYLALELQSFAVYVIAAINRFDKQSTHSALIYFMLGGLSSSLILLGITLIYSQTGILDLTEIAILLDSKNIQTSWAFTLGGVAVAAGLLFKITAAPFHQWGPDVYDGVPTTITSWIAVVPKLSLLILFFNISISLNAPIVQEVVGSQFPVWSTLLLASSLLSLVLGTVVGLAQVRVKRLLAYSTVSHVGFLLLALSIGGQDSTAAYLFYVVQYTLTSLLAFLIVLGLGYYTSENTNTTQTTYDLSAIDELQGSFLRSPALAACLAVTLFSMAGVPPLVGFFAKQAVLTTAVKAGYLFVSIVGVVTSVISASYYLYLIRVSHINQMTTGGHYKINFIGGRENVTVINGEINTQSRITATHSYVVAVLTLSLIGFIATPQIVLDTCRLMALTQYNI